ncbi:MAG: hypothetical protein ABW321_05345 [Polyangiales bacterium]
MGDLQDLVFQVAPIRVSLGAPGRWLLVEAPSAVEIVEGVGVRVVTDLRLRWDVIGIGVPVTLRRVDLRLSPRVELDNGVPVLAFGVFIEEADVIALPGFLDDMIVGRVNEALGRRENRIVWRFLETLDFRFALPAQVQPAYSMRLFARAGDVVLKNNALKLGVDWGLTAESDHSGIPDL